MTKKKNSETITENIFHVFYGASTFIEKNLLSVCLWLYFKGGTDYAGYPDFSDLRKKIIVLLWRLKQLDHIAAQKEVQYYCQQQSM